jgi:hypothetical protein
MERGGKIVWAQNQEILIANVKKKLGEEPADGEVLPVVSKELGHCEIYPQYIQHNPNGRLLVRAAPSTASRRSADRARSGRSVCAAMASTSSTLRSR